MAEAGNTKQYPWSSVYYAKQSTIGFFLFNKNTYIEASLLHILNYGLKAVLARISRVPVATQH